MLSSVVGKSAAALSRKSMVSNADDEAADRKWGDGIRLVTSLNMRIDIHRQVHLRHLHTQTVTGLRWHMCVTWIKYFITFMYDELCIRDYYMQLKIDAEIKKGEILFASRFRFLSTYFHHPLSVLFLDRSLNSSPKERLSLCNTICYFALLPFASRFRFLSTDFHHPLCFPPWQKP